MDELMMCPGCGSKGRIHDQDFYYEGECDNSDCGCSAGCYDTEEEAVAAWNTRSPLSDPRIQRLVEVAEKQVSNFENPEYRTRMTLLQACRLFDNWRKELRAALDALPRAPASEGGKEGEG